MEIREVKIEEYWPQIVKGTAEFGQIAVALNPEFNKLAKCIYEVLNESFVATASEFGVSRWEHILGISPAAGDTLDDRKARILTYLNIKLPYTWRVLKQMLVPILGGEDKFVMEYINDECKLVLHTDRLDDAMLATVDDLLERVLPQNIEVVQYNHHIEISWRDINKYAECETYADVVAVNPRYMYDAPSDGVWYYPFTKLKSTAKEWLKGLFSGYYYEAPDSHLRKVDLYLPSLEFANLLLYENRTVTEASIDAPLLKEMHNTLGGRTLKKVKLNLPNVTYVDFATSGNPLIGLTEIEAYWPKLNRTGEFLIRTVLNKRSAVHIFDSLPEWNSGTHTATIGIHIDHQFDEEVLTAIANAEAKGWTLTVQWNGTPTSGVSTMDLEEIWCKVTESEHGDYTDENGNRCMLDWGHYVTDTTEYKLFFSLVEAEEYFKLTRIENNE